MPPPLVIVECLAVIRAQNQYYVFDHAFRFQEIYESPYAVVNISNLTSIESLEAT